MNRRRVLAVTVALALAYTAVGGVSFASSTTTADPTPSSYSAIAPTALSTRIFTANKSLNVQVTSVGTIPADATSVQVNVNISAGTDAGSLSLYPVGDSKPAQASVYWAAGQTLTESLVVGLGTGGQIRITNGVGSVTPRVTAVGYYAPNGDVLASDINSEDSDEGDLLTSNGDGTASWQYPNFQPAWTNTYVVPASGTPQQNGQRLIAAMVTAPGLVRLDAGIYDLGSAGLTIPTNHAVEGAGEDLTTIESSASTAITMSDTSDLRALRIESGSPTGTDVAVPTGDRVTIDSIQTLDDFGITTTNPTGISNAGYTVISNSDIEPFGTSFVTGIRLTGTAQTTINNTIIKAASSSPTASFLEGLTAAASTITVLNQDNFEVDGDSGASTQVLTINQAGTMTVRDSVLTAKDGGTYTVADNVSNGSYLSASGSSFVAYGISSGTSAGVIQGGHMNADTTSFNGAPGTTSYGVDVTSTANGTFVQESQVEGNGFSFYRGASPINVGGSYVGEPTTGTGSIFCVDDYNKNYVATTGLCG